MARIKLLTLTPLVYCGASIGYAKIDGDLGLASGISWRLDLPVSLRKRDSKGLPLHTPDVIAAMLCEDSSIRTRCHPYWLSHTFGSLTVRLSRLVLRPELVPMFNNLITMPRGHPEKELIHHELKHQLRSISRVCFLNHDRTDCRRENLVELVDQLPESDESRLVHEDM